MTAKEAVGKLTISQLIQLVSEYEEFEKTSVTCDTLLRQTTEEFAGINNPAITLNMTGTALAAYRRLAQPVISKFDLVVNPISEVKYG